MRAGLKPHEIDDLTWRDFSLYVQAYQLRSQEDWEKLRLSCYYPYLAVPEKGQKKGYYQFMPFWWDKKDEEDWGEDLTEEQLLQITKMYG
jgi:hypothetical protein